MALTVRPEVSAQNVVKNMAFIFNNYRLSCNWYSLADNGGYSKDVGLSGVQLSKYVVGKIFDTKENT